MAVVNTTENSIPLKKEKSAAALEFGKIFHSVRRQMLMSQSQMGTMLGIGTQNVSSIERGERQPTYSTIRQLIFMTGVDPAVFFPPTKPSYLREPSGPIVYGGFMFAVLGRVYGDPEKGELFAREYDILECGHRVIVGKGDNVRTLMQCPYCRPQPNLRCCGRACQTEFCPNCGKKPKREKISDGN